MNTTYVPVSVKVRVTGSWGNEYTDIVFTITIMLPQYIVLEPLKVYYINVSISSELSIGSIGSSGYGDGIKYIDIVDVETMEKILRINLGEVYIGEYIGVDPAVKAFPVEYSSDGRKANFTAALIVPDDPQLLSKLKGRELAIIIRPVFEGVGIYTYPHSYTYYYQDCNITYVDMPAKLYFIEQESEGSVDGTYSGTVTETITKTIATTQTISKTITLTRTKTITSPIMITYTKTKTITTPITITKTITKYLNNTLTTTHIRTMTSKIYIPVNKTITITTTLIRLSTTTIMKTISSIMTFTLTATFSGFPSRESIIISVLVLLLGLIIAIILAKR